MKISSMHNNKITNYFSEGHSKKYFDMINDDLSTFSGKASNIPPMLQLLASLLEVFKALLVTCCIFRSRWLVVLWAKLF